ncbi:hypothetical protein [endosymbiont 'TC1' of Trimyema compressum]|uniref:hypothetical protein n=1 Tax=endosymbiont 'TC1' of Trimyema compressum TaxID=243899 RepID=UPI00155EDDF2|nr:hypothetical protein [endosymbiont 'TC1' of Trimyema compressum]
MLLLIYQIRMVLSMSDFLNKFSKTQYSDKNQNKGLEDKKDLPLKEHQKTESISPPRRNIENFEKRCILW